MRRKSVNCKKITPPLESSASRELEVTPGMHEVSLTAPGRVPAVRYVHVKAGTQIELGVELAVAQPAAAPTPPRPRPLAPAPAPAHKKPVSPDDYMLDPFTKE